jgi:polyhydroxybutyrate depolymerase
MRRYHIVESAARYGAIAVAPDGVARGWNDGRAASAPAFAEQRSVDDIGFIAALIAQLRSRYSIDPTRVYAIGMSNGGIFAQYLACKRADLFAGIGSVASSMAKEIACAPSRGLSVAIVDGTADPVVPFAGGAVGLTTKDRGSVIGAPRTIAFWARADRCRESPMRTSLTHRASNDLTSATVARYVRCSGNTAVTFVTIEGGGHTWPGERGRSIPALGATSHDLDATDFLFETLLR